MENKKIALVTGASRGIGKSISSKLLEQGYLVIGTATSSIGVENLLKRNIKGFELDLNNKSSIDAFWESVIAEFRSVNILVNNAGITRDNIILRMSEDEWNEVVNVHLNGAFYMCKIASKMMMKERWGRIVNISSTSAAIGNQGQANYAAAKAGLEAFTRTLAREFGSRGITANTIAPGFISTDMTDHINDNQKKEIIKDIPLGRFGLPDEIAELVNFIISDEASYITGQTIHLNGGMYM
jgi:3-oxoacyl-[acyl-carrier protein] reductase